MTAVQYRPSSFSPHFTDTRVASPATHNSDADGHAAGAGPTAIGPSQPGSGLFSSGRSATNSAATTYRHEKQLCDAEIARKSGWPG